MNGLPNTCSCPALRRRRYIRFEWCIYTALLTSGYVCAISWYEDAAIVRILLPQPGYPLGKRPERIPRPTSAIITLQKQLPNPFIFSPVQKSAHPIENTRDQVPLSSHSCALFCCKPRVFSLFTKHTGGVYPIRLSPQFSSRYRCAFCRKTQKFAISRHSRGAEIARCRGSQAQRDSSAC
jgi:hypothetical protein